MTALRRAGGSRSVGGSARANSGAGESPCATRSPPGATESASRGLACRCRWCEPTRDEAVIARRAPFTGIDGERGEPSGRPVSRPVTPRSQRGHSPRGRRVRCPCSVDLHVEVPGPRPACGPSASSAVGRCRSEAVAALSVSVTGLPATIRRGTLPPPRRVTRAPLRCPCSPRKLKSRADSGMLPWTAAMVNVNWARAGRRDRLLALLGHRRAPPPSPSLDRRADAPPPCRPRSPAATCLASR